MSDAQLREAFDLFDSDSYVKFIYLFVVEDLFILTENQ